MTQSKGTATISIEEYDRLKKCEQDLDATNPKEVEIAKRLIDEASKMGIGDCSFELYQPFYDKLMCIKMTVEPFNEKI